MQILLMINEHFSVCINGLSSKKIRADK